MTSLNETETREDIPLKSSSKKSSICTCNEYLFEGSKFVTTAFIFLTAVITIALIVQIYYGDFQVVPHGSVATDSRQCSEIGTFVLKQGGNAVDAAIASAVCLAVVNPHTSGLDATIDILIYDHKTRQNASSIHFHDFNNNRNVTLPKLIIHLAQLHQLYGQLPWKTLLTPSADLAMRGFYISKQFEQSIKKAKARNLYKHVVAGESMTLNTLANTIRTIAEIPTEDLYNQVNFIGKASRVEGTKIKFNNFNIFMPNSTEHFGKYLIKNLERVEELNLIKDDVNEVDYVYKLANVCLYTYNEAHSLNNVHKSTISNIAVMDLNDIYVSLVIGMYTPFGSKKMTDFGYLLDIESSMPFSILPLIITHRNYICGKRIVLGTNDISVATQILTSWTFGVENATTVIEYPRFTLVDNETIGFEDERLPTFSDDAVHKLQNLGNPAHVKEPYNSCNFVEKFADNLNSHSDSRGGGISSRF